MIYLEMAGRLGNQMFRYSFARKLSLLSGEELVIDFKRVYEKGEKDKGWDNSLKMFNTANYIEVNNKKKEYFYKKVNFKQLILYVYFKTISKLLKKNKQKLKKFQLKMQPILNRHNLYFLELGYYEYDLGYLKKNEVKFVCGCFECSKYFNDIKEEIKNEFIPKKSIETKNEKLFNMITTSNSVCITVRRGDFVTNANNKKIYDICSPQYFNKAIEIIKNKIDNPVFFVFSDDVKWAIENIEFNNCEVYSEDGLDSVDEKLRLMSACKHFIISNSTFSWWAQYLSKNEDKIVISPSSWYKTNIESDLIEKEWIKIDVQKNEVKYEN